MNLNHCMRYLDVGLPEDILRYKTIGDFTNAVRLIDRRLPDPALDESLRCCMIAQREMMLRTPENFPYSREDALKIIREHIPDFTEAEFDERVDNGTVRWIYRDGVPHYFLRFFPTLVKTEPEFAHRAGQIPSTTVSQEGENNPLDRCMRIMKEQGSMACRIRVHAGLRIDDAHFVPGGQALVSIPIPAFCDTQSEIVLEKIFPAGAVVDPGDAPQRTVWWKETMQENHEFFVEYSYVHREVYHGEDFTGPADPDASRYLVQQGPHIVFSPYLRNLAADLTRGLTEPLEKARAIYDYITLNMHYTYMPEYFILEEIAENCARSRTGDCGVFALLFLTLCRIAGVPACWESGNAAEPDDLGSHDWVRFYAEPYGWLFADPSYGISSHRVGNEERRRFYFGNLDPYRMVANREFQADLLCGMEGWRADPYDNQSGEVQLNGIGLSWEQYTCRKEILSHEEL